MVFSLALKDDRVELCQKKSVVYETEFREVSRTRPIYCIETHTSDLII